MVQLTAVSDLSGNETGSGEVTLTWTNPNSANNMTGFEITVQPVPFGPIAIYSAATSEVSKVITDLTPGTRYYFSLVVVANSLNTSSTASNVVDITLSGGAVCFLGSAPVLTPVGYRRIDSLAVGDLVRTADGRDVAIVRVKHQRIGVPSAAVNPYVIPKGAWGATENLAISPRHCVAVPGRGMVEARELGLKQLSLRAAFDYYNLELPEWDNMVVAGVEVESLAPKKRVVMTVTELAKLVAGKPVEKLANLVTVLGDGRVAVQMTRKERRRA